MPVRFEGKSEYDRRFVWRPSHRGASFVASPAEAAPSAGVSSARLALGKTVEPPIQRKKDSAPDTSMAAAVQQSGDYQMMEPAIQRKKKPIVPKGTHTAAGDRAEEYMLLGNQSKFTTNVKYGIKGKVDRSQENGTRMEKQRAPSPPPAPRNPPPPPRVQVDTGAPRIFVPPNPKTMVKSKAVGVGVPRLSLQDPPPPQPSQAAPQVAKRTAEKRKASKPMSPTQINPSKEVKVKDARQKRKGHMEEDVQTDLDQGVTSSVQHAPADYAMKYKAGIAPPRSQGPKRVSEYQLQFQWKDPVHNSPLLSADQMVHRSTTDVGPYKAAPLKKSEYAMQFHAPQQDCTANPKKKTKLKRSRSLEDLNQRPAAGKARVTTDTDKRLIEGSMNPLRTFFPTGKSSHQSSEYLANFAAPNHFEYKKGAWKGAAPPHIAATEQHVERPSPTWYNEVLELRAKADEYRKRAQGTHFSREHLAQLYAQQAELWDTVSNSGSLSALSLERSDATPDIDDTPKSTPKVPKQKASRKKRSSAVQTTPTHVRTAWGEDDLDAVSAALATAGSEELVYYDDDASTLVGDENYPPPTPPPSQQSSSVGRIPTPKMAAVTSTSKTSSYRHHLDRTTPVHGSLLASPPRQTQSNPVLKKGKKTSSGDSVASSGSSVPVQPARRWTSEPAIAGQLPRHATPTFGMPTRDSHPLLDEEASIDRPLSTHFVHSPEKSKLSVIEENMAETYGQKKGRGKNRPVISSQGQQWEVKLDDIPRRETDDDVLSLSVRSVASSCSMASEVLERAKNRRDEFWGPKKAASRS